MNYRIQKWIIIRDFYRATAGRSQVYLALQLIVLSDCLFIFSASPFWTLLIDAFPVYLSHPPWIFSESLHSGRDGLQPERDLQLLLYAGQWLALRRVVLQDIAVHCDAEYLRIGLHPNGHLNRQVSSHIHIHIYPLLSVPPPHFPNYSTNCRCAWLVYKVCEASWFGWSAPLSICASPENSSI